MQTSGQSRFSRKPRLSRATTQSSQSSRTRSVPDIDAARCPRTAPVMVRNGADTYPFHASAEAARLARLRPSSMRSGGASLPAAESCPSYVADQSRRGSLPRYTGCGMLTLDVRCCGRERRRRSMQYPGKRRHPLNVGAGRVTGRISSRSAFAVEVRAEVRYGYLWSAVSCPSRPLRPCKGAAGPLNCNGRIGQVRVCTIAPTAPTTLPA